MIKCGSVPHINLSSDFLNTCMAPLCPFGILTPSSFLFHERNSFGFSYELQFFCELEDYSTIKSVSTGLIISCFVVLAYQTSPGVWSLLNTRLMKVSGLCCGWRFIALYPPLTSFQDTHPFTLVSRSVTPTFDKLNHTLVFETREITSKFHTNESPNSKQH